MVAGTSTSLVYVQVLLASGVAPSAGSAVLIAKTPIDAIREKR